MIVRVLLDTHVYLWWAQNDPRLSAAAYGAIRTSSEARISIVTAWEIAIKYAIGKLKMAPLSADLLDRHGFTLLGLTLDHAAESAYLPIHHRDPFDRMLVAQARHERLTLITHDRRLLAYDVAIIRA